MTVPRSLADELAQLVTPAPHAGQDNNIGSSMKHMATSSAAYHSSLHMVLEHSLLLTASGCE